MLGQVFKFPAPDYTSGDGCSGEATALPRWATPATRSTTSTRGERRRQGTTPGQYHDCSARPPGDNYLFSPGARPPEPSSSCGTLWSFLLKLSPNLPSWRSGRRSNNMGRSTGEPHLRIEEVKASDAADTEAGRRSRTSGGRSQRRCADVARSRRPSRSSDGRVEPPSEGPREVGRPGWLPTGVLFAN